MASTSHQEIRIEPELHHSIKQKDHIKALIFDDITGRRERRRFKWIVLLFLASGCVYSIVEYFQSSTVSCVLYVNGKRDNTYEGTDNCTSVKLLNQTSEVRPEIHYQTSYLISSGVCFLIIVAILAYFFLPCNLFNYRTCYRRTTCCCAPITLREGIHRYMNGYISDEQHFQKVIQSCQRELLTIVDALKSHIPEVTFDVMTTGSMQERLGKPSFIKLGKEGNLPMKSILSSDFDVMLSPKTIMASRKDDSFTSRPTLFHVVTPHNAPPGFVWLRMNQDYQESRDMFWKNICIESHLSDECEGLFLSSFEARNVFVNGMKRIRGTLKGNFLIDWYLKLKNKGAHYKVKAQGPAVTVEVQERTMFLCAPKIFRSTLFYGDFIFAIRCTGWPEEAKDWSERLPRYWPKPGVVLEVLNAGYHVVPKPSIPFLYKKMKKKNKKNKKNNEGPVLQEYEWRLSYSLAEITLSKKIPPAARACLLALKATIKRHQNKTRCVSTYHLKTVLYWALEQNPPDFWCEERIEECFMKLVDTLLECATNRICSHYFMPQVNLMATVEEKHLDCLINFLSKLKENPMKYLSSSNLRCLSNLAAFYECINYNHGKDFYMDIY